MKLRKITLALALIFCALAFADNFVIITFSDGTTTKKKVDPSTETLSFGEAMKSLIFSDGTEYSFSNIDHISFAYENENIPSNTIVVTWNESEAPTIEGSASGVTAEINEGNVTLTNTNTDTEYTYVLSGSSTAGSFTLVAEYKSTIKLNGVNLKSNLEEALNIKCGKRINLELVEGTTNTLEDCTTDNGQKGALYCKGHLEVSGTGTLNLTGNIKHGLSTKEYCQIKKSAGTINVIKAVNDGIHAGQYFKMSGGEVNISGVGGDGIQAEITDDPEDEDNGRMIIKGGKINVRVTSDDVEGLKADSLITISAGEITVNTSGKGSKGIKTDGDIVIGDENTMTGPTLTVSTTGGAYDDGTGTGGGGGGGWPPGGGGGGGGWGQDAGSGSKAIKCDGSYYQYGGDIYISTTGEEAEGIESKKNTANAMNFNGGNLYMKVKDDCINSAGQINFNGANVICYSTGNDAIDSNYGKNGAITITAGVVISFTTKGSPEMGIDADNMKYVKVSGGTLITGGGLQGGGSATTIGSGSTHYKAWSSNISYTAGQYYSVVCGDNIITWLQPCSLSSSYNVYASDQFTSSTTHYIYKGTTVPTSSEANYDFRNASDGEVKTMIWIKSNITSGTSVASFKPN